MNKKNQWKDKDENGMKSQVSGQRRKELEWMNEFMRDDVWNMSDRVLSRNMRKLITFIR